MRTLHSVLTVLIAGVWLANGLFCKVLNFVPRHQEIVAHILGNAHARMLTLAIGILEIVMALWILIRYVPKLNAVVQITVVTAMNILEFIFVPNLLLWGRLNMVFALLFVVLVYYNTFILRRKLHRLPQC